MTEFIIPFILGGAGHILATLIEESKRAGKTITIRIYQDLHPYQLSLSIIMSIAAFYMLHEANQLNIASAVAAGYMGDSIVNKFIKPKH